MSHDAFVRRRVAEHVLPGHPDKLADAIADALVQAARRRSRAALAGVEVAVHRHAVFVDGRIACKGARGIDVEKIVRGVYRSAGYGGDWEPQPDALHVVTDLVLDPLHDDEARLRALSDDQCILTGYATTRRASMLPPEQDISWRLARGLATLRAERPDLGLGPDGKVIVAIDENAGDGSLAPVHVSVSIQARDGAVERVAAIRELAVRVLCETPGMAASDDTWSDLAVAVNGAGDFEIGGPMGDNGLSGKKLVADAYGPRVPIGGGAMSGKDFFKPDRAGAIVARRAALLACRALGMRDALVTLAVQPGERELSILSVQAGDGREMAPAGRAALSQLLETRLERVGSTVPPGLDLVEIARWGHFTPHREAQRLIEVVPPQDTRKLA